MIEELSDNAKRIFENLYSFQNETIEQTFKRVANEFATNTKEQEIAYNLLTNNIWRPNTPVFLNAGTKHKVFSACYVVSLEDNMESIYNVANVSRKVFQFGSGIGIPIGNLRESNAYIYEGDKSIAPEGKSSGPITFMKLYDAVGETTKSGGRVRRAAILCALPIWHPDIMDFINCKEEDGRLSNMNISVAITDKFMKSLDDGISFDLNSPSDGSKVGEIEAEELWDRLSYMNWKSADPGILFIDNINKFNPLKKEIMIETTNPCVLGNTLVSTDKGDIRIDELMGDEKVLTYDTKDDIIELESVEFVGKMRIDVDVISIEMEDGEILELTPDHKVYTENRGYVIASDLNEDDVLLMLE